MVDVKAVATTGLSTLARDGWPDRSKRGGLGHPVEGGELMLKAVLLFGAGYVLGSKAGHERYAQIEAVAKRVSDELDKRSRPPAGHSTS